MGEGGFAKCLRFSKWGETFYANREETGGVCQLPTFVYYVEGEGFKYRLCMAPFAFTHQLTKSQSVEIVSDELNTLSSVLSTSRQTSAIGTATTT